MTGQPDLEAPPGCRGLLEPAYKPILFVLILMVAMGAAITVALFILGPGLNSPGGNPPGGGPGGASFSPAPVPPISERFFDTGTSHAEVSGALTLAGDLPIDTIASYVSNQGRAWIVFGPPDPNALLVQVTFNEPEDTVTVTQGVLRATGMDGECAFSVQVTETLVSGHISCPSVDAFDGDRNIGKAAIELDFTAGSSAGPEGEGDGNQ